MRLIDADALYERACELEAQALSYAEQRVEDWRIWSAVLTERASFKHDIMYAPTIEERKEERKKGQWTEENACEFCGFQPWYERDIHTLSFCPNCGADMRAIESEG